MFQKTVSIVGLLICGGVGALLGFIAMAMQVVLAPESRIKRVLAHLNWPVDRAITWYAGVFHNGNTDQVIPLGVLLWATYWLTLGAAAGLTCYGIGRCCAKR